MAQGSELGREIRRLRAAAGLTQGQLAGAVGASQTTVSQWERGVARPGPAHVEAIARVLGDDPERLASLPAPTRRPGRTGRAVRAARERLGLTAAETGMLVGVSASAVLSWERGAWLPSPSVVAALAEALGIDGGVLASDLELDRRAQRRRPRSESPASPTAFGAGVRSARKAKGMTQLQLAEAVGVGQTAVSSWERGAHPRPMPRTLARLRQVLGDDL